MRYASKHCTHFVCITDGKLHRFAGNCIISGRPVSVIVKDEELEAYNKGAYIQDALKSNTADEREFLMSGISGEEFDKLFREEEE